MKTHKLTSLRFLKLNLECHNIKMRRKHMNIYCFSFMRLCSKSPSCNRILQLFLQLQSFLKTQLLQQLQRVKKHYTNSQVKLYPLVCTTVIFEAINQVLNKRMKKLQMEYEPFICTIIFYLILCTRFRKELLMLSLR